ncbi:MAG: hypothetical protein R3F61_11995 [Myxococcota bacterium]
MNAADANRPIDAISFSAMTAFVIAGALEVAQAMPVGTHSGLSIVVPALFGLGTYLAVCSTFFTDFALYRAKADRVVALFGVEDVHLVHRVAGFVSMGASVWLLSGLWAPVA